MLLGLVLLGLVLLGSVLLGSVRWAGSLVPGLWTCRYRWGDLWITVEVGAGAVMLLSVEPVEILRRLRGTGTREQILQHCSRWALEQAVRRAEIERTGHGRYALPDLPAGLAVAASLSGALSHTSAALYWGMAAICRPTQVHVTVARSARRRPGRSTVLHYVNLGHIPHDERVTPPLRTVLDCARILPFAEALAIADSALRLELVTADELAKAGDGLKGAGSGRIRRVTGQADGAAANPFESALRAVVIESGVGGFRAQFEVPDTRYRVDLADPLRLIVLEGEGADSHIGLEAFDRDLRRYNELIGKGWMVLRFTYRQVMFDPEWVAGMVVGGCRLRNDRKAGRKSH